MSSAKARALGFPKSPEVAPRALNGAIWGQTLGVRFELARPPQFRAAETALPLPRSQTKSLRMKAPQTSADPRNPIRKKSRFGRPEVEEHETWSSSARAYRPIIEGPTTPRCHGGRAGGLILRRALDLPPTEGGHLPAEVMLLPAEEAIPVLILSGAGG